MNELRDEIARLRDKIAGSNLADGNSKEDVAQMQVGVMFQCSTYIFEPLIWFYVNKSTALQKT